MIHKELRVLVDCVIYTVLVFVATIIIQIQTPATGGYLNLGESMIYVAAILSSPLVAGIAGGVGASLADIVTGYSIFAPGTLVIKFIEGLVVGLLFSKLSKLRKFSFITGLALATAFSLVSIYIGLLGIEITLGYGDYIINISFQPVVWVTIAFLVFLLILAISCMERGLRNVKVISMICGGSLMVLGYFLYEFFISNPLTGREPMAALAEVPGNISQMVMGIIIALPLVEFIERASRR
ncbi:MAG: hypothetical protein DRO18_04455 [Thermoprotei archaeon]|nr:MAG: hypothetical protein DRO18_04455 [Thermoprotei archaeon]